MSHADEWDDAPSLHAMPRAEQRDDVTRALPHAVGPEKSLLSTMLMDPQEFIGLAIEEKLTRDHFYLPQHQILFSFLLELFAAGEEIELVSLVQKLLDRGLLDRVGGPSTLTDLYTYAPSSGHFRHHLKLVKEKHVARALILMAAETEAAAYESPDEIVQLLEDTERRIMAIRDLSMTDRPQTIKQAVNAVIAEFESEIQGGTCVQGLRTGFDLLDQMTGGLQPGNMFVIGARPSMGKTSLMMNIVEHIAITEKVATLVFTAEMDTIRVTSRLVFSRARFAKSQLSRGYTATKGDLQRVQRSAIEVASAPIYFDDTSGPSISYIRAKSRRMAREFNIGFIAIDYLGLIKSNSKQAQNSREREVSEISAGIKGLAKDLGIPILILAQLNRQTENRGGGKSSAKAGKPRMSDLKDSGSIEADADIIGLLYRDAYYAEGDDEKAASAGRTELEIAKNRNGSTGAIPLTFIADLMRFESGAPAPEDDMFTTPTPTPGKKSRHEY